MKPGSFNQQSAARVEMLWPLKDELSKSPCCQQCRGQIQSALAGPTAPLSFH